MVFQDRFPTAGGSVAEYQGQVLGEGRGTLDILEEMHTCFFSLLLNIV